MREALLRVRVPLAGILAIFLITIMAFFFVKPGAFERRAQWSITGNAVLDESLFDTRMTERLPCSQIEDPVCGTDGVTHRNFCLAHQAGAEMRHHGECTTNFK